MKATDVAQWMLVELQKHSCIYQDDVVDHIVKSKADTLLRENTVGNLVVGREVLEAFKRATETTVVWVKPERYWRYRVKEDELGREARG
jgi:hypothetical protein